MELYRGLPPEDRYFLLCGRERGALAPLLEGLGEEQRAAFENPPESLTSAMLSEAGGR